MELATRFGGEIVNADALQVYRGLDIGTAKPSREERERIPHHLIDILEPEERYSAGAFARQARDVLAKVAGRGERAWLVGGSGFYLQALLEGLHDLPRVPEAVRAELRRTLETEGLSALRRELEAVDPASATRIDAGDTQRTLRALEVARWTGKPLSQWLRRPAPESKQVRALKIGLTLPRGILYDEIVARIRRMIEAGWLAEVEGLLARGVSTSCPAFQAIGYRQLVGHLEGTSTLDGAIEEIERETRRYAKRQMTWFRRMADVHWIRDLDPGDRVQRACDLLIADSEGPE
jgi:tRNA dimethylallyltransferase